MDNAGAAGIWVAAQAREIQVEETIALAKSLMVAKYGELFETMDAQAQAGGQKSAYLVVEPERA